MKLTPKQKQLVKEYAKSLLGKKLNEATEFNVKDLPKGAILKFKDGETWKITKIIGNSHNPRGYLAAPYGKTKDHYISLSIEFTIKQLIDTLESVS